MAVEQGRLTPTDTTTDMDSFYTRAPALSVDDTNRVIHNNTQILRLVLQRPQPVAASRGKTTSPDSLTSTPHYIDKLFSSNPSVDIDIMRLDFGLNNAVDATAVVVWSTQLIDTVTGNWVVATSIDGSDTQFNSLIANTTSVDFDTEDPDGNGTQFKYTINIDPPPGGDGLRFWRIKHTGLTGAFDDVTEVQIVPPLAPTISVFNSDGTFFTSKAFEQISGVDPDILDACWDTVNSRFYTVRFNDQSTGSTSINLDDDFSPAEAGTASGTNNFNPARWTESAANPQFIRLNEELSYNVSSGKGQIETTYSLSSDGGAEIFANPKAVNAKNEWFALRALDTTNNNLIVSEGVGYDTSPTATGVWFTSRLDNFIDSSGNCDLRELRSLWHNTQLGTDSFTVTFSGSVWNVSGTLTGALTDAQTGVDYNEGVDASTPVEFVLSCTASPSNGEQFTFDLITDRVTKPPATSGTIGFTRTGSNLQTNQVIGSPVSVSTSSFSVELFGNTGGSINIVADDFAVSGTSSFPDIPVFTVERRDQDGAVLGSPLISTFDVIGSPNAVYNDFLDGRVQIAATSSGTTGGQFVFIKVNNVLYKYSSTSSLGTEDGSNSLIGTTPSGPVTGQIARDGTHSLQWTHRSGDGTPFLSYIEYDSGLDIIHLRTLDKDTLQDTTSTREVLLNISGYSTNELRVFYKQDDFDTLYYVDTSDNLQSFNVDDRISAFMAVNAEDSTLPAGTEQDTPVNADVINAWGETLDGKLVTFSVTAGDGAVTPSSDTTGTPTAGRATTTFTVGSTVGVSTITATVSE